ncbi:histidine phosphatase family protein [Nesterenkonia alkaliphila]|uniref:Histidine phosphatase family protein n=1 Tax=Nesterenkonia alkaliphila TaxID=1463631 RepID=A0A7K1UFL1_9MICC|nr:histidine phosphatase family protein [Nesterenkonia alkaliphila]MVT25174.1 histidine phosphatase family protein [Nesterenkonia alkaliphila]GFZ96247.1 fructose 2,6-bisphosphatase [Nesterenkonia alkaliphila]
MADTATVHLVRHGEVHNPQKVLYGRIPGYGLSELGKQMAQGIADYFGDRAERGRPVHLLAASPLQRAQETIAPLAQRLGLPVLTENRVLEAENAFEGLSNVKRHLRTPKYWPLLVNPFRPSWGEPYKQQVERVLQAVKDLSDRALAEHGDGAEVVVVSHQLPIWVTRLWAEQRPLWHDPRQRECTLTSVTSLHIGPAGVESVSYSEPNKELSKQALALPGA